MSRPGQIAKITRPSLPSVVIRKRLFALLDKGRKAELTWVSGPGGSGKTTLLASYLDSRKLPCLWYDIDETDGDVATFFYYMGLAGKKAAPAYRKTLPLLTSEYLNGIRAFTKKFFETLCSRLNLPYVFVFDNYHEAAPESLFHEVFRHALSAIPEGIEVIVASRSAPPPVVAALAAYNGIRSIGWEELRFDLAETRSLLRSGKKKADAAVAAGFLDRTEGWAAGLALISERLKSRTIAPHELYRFSPAELFDYFATELFDKTDESVQDFLLRTAFMPRLSVSHARELTGVDDAGSIFDSMVRNHFFIEQRSSVGPVYQYHPLFRDFLQLRAKETYTGREIRGVVRRSAVLLENAGQLDDAAELYRTSADWNGLSCLIVAHAEMMISQGRSGPVEEWLKSIPAELSDGDAWLLYWKGVCRMAFDLRAARGFFERSFALFRRQHNPSGVFLSWAGAVEAVIQEMGDIRRLRRYVVLFEELIAEYEFPSEEIEAHITFRIFTALPWRKDNPAFRKWKKKAFELMETDADPGLKMLTGFFLFSYNLLWAGDYTASRHVLEVMRRILLGHKDLPPIALIMERTSEAVYSWLEGSAQRSLEMTAEGLAIAEETGVHIWDYSLLMSGAGACLCSGDLDKAEELIGKMAAGARLFDRFYYRHDSSWRYMLLHDIPQALFHERAALELAEKSGFEILAAQSNFAMAHLMRACGESGKARVHITRCRELGRRIGSGIVEFMTGLSEAALAFDLGDDGKGLTFLGNAFSLGREKGYSFFSWWHPSLVTPLCVRALEAGIEVDYVRDLITMSRLTPEGSQVWCETWPWAVKVRTLGFFEVARNDRPLQFSGKVQKKPLEMMKALIALGGANVREDRLIDALWPEADGDTARIAFKTTLHRLRKLLGREDTVLMRDSRLSLNRRICWVDTYAFENTAALAEEAIGVLRRRNPKKGILDRAETAAALYRGDFLADEDDKTWAGPLREHLRSRYIRLVKSLGEYWASRTPHECENAITWFRYGIEADAVDEELYQKLMLCYRKLGNKAEAVKVYRRCREALSAVLDIEPSERTEGLYQEIIK